MQYTRAMPPKTTPSAPALPLFSEVTDPAKRARRASTVIDEREHYLPTELRVIVDDFIAMRQRLLSSILPAAGDLPRRWREPSDPVLACETRKANAMLTRGRADSDAAGALAFAIVARSCGLPKARDALRAASLGS